MNFKLFLVLWICRSVYSIAKFPEYFKFGSASSAYQIEGAWNLDGKSPSIWDSYVHDNPHLIENASTGDIASYSYQFYKKDVAALKSVGFNFYRFSISWSRILPEGIPTKINQPGIDYYNKLIDELISNGIEPMVTMCHWDIPQVLEDQGGFLNSSFQYWFKDYSRVLFQNFGDRIKTWIPLNEPSIMCAFGYGIGLFAPNKKSSGTSDYLCGHNSILAHAQAYHLYKKEFFNKQGGRIGTSFNGGPALAHESENGIEPDDLRAAERSIQWEIGLNAHPLFTGDYPKVIVDRVARLSAEEGFARSRLPAFSKEELEFVKGTADFFGLNYYTSVVSKHENTKNLNVSMAKDCACFNYKKKEWPKAKSSWLYSYPEGLAITLRWIKDEYNNPEVIITENGWSEEDDDAEDIGRITFFRDHLNAILDAIDDGCNVTAHTTWSLIDNFQWNIGYNERFGLFYVDFNSETKERIEKPSADFIRRVIRERIVPETITKSNLNKK